MKKITNHINRILQQTLLCLAIALSLSVWSQDTTPPDVPVIDSVTVQWVAPVNSNGDVLITWQASDSADVRSYYIKYLDEVLGTYKLLDSVDANTTTYLDTKPITDPHYPITYVVQAVDSSNNTSNHSDRHKTIRVFPWQKDENCQTKVELSWNAYEGWNEGILHFDLYSVVNNAHQYIGRFDANETVYLYPIGSETINYEFYMRVYSVNGRSSTSNKIPFTPNIPQLPSFIEAQFATVQGDQVSLSFGLDSTADINNYRLVRSNDTMATFQTIMQFANYSQQLLPVTDASANVHSQPYYYKLYLYNDCNDVIDSSRTLSTIFLNGNNSGSYQQTLTWSSYFDGTLSDKEYQLYRFSESAHAFPYVIFQTEASNSYTDNLKEQNFESFVGDFCYYIQSTEPKTGFEISSNTICLSQEPSVIMPTAFAPNGFAENRVFKPAYAFIAPHPYYFAVFDRWGSKIFETTDYKVGFTGREGGYSYTNGTYSYYLEYYSSKGEKFTNTGTFKLIN